ncbi:MAG: AAA family ATPase [Acidobacteriota bacterium]|nr:MAG: AAA family ATPase [Acidobacteriota bacterium]
MIGLTGPNAAGKGEVARCLADGGFSVHSLSDVVREEARRRGLGVDRETLIRIGRELRREGGPGVLAERMLPRLGERDVVDSIRHPAEVLLLRQRTDFHLLGIDAPIELRWQRAHRRGRPGDRVDLETFSRQEQQENQDRPESQQLMRALALCDVVLRNEQCLETLRRRLRSVVEIWSSAPPLAPRNRVS